MRRGKGVRLRGVFPSERKGGLVSFLEDIKQKEKKKGREKKRN